MEKINFTLFEIRVDVEKQVWKLPKVGDFNLTIDQLRETIKDEIDNAFDEMKKNAVNEFDHGIVVMPYIKANYKKTLSSEAENC